MNLKKGDIVKIKKGTRQDFVDSNVKVFFNDNELLMVKKVDDTSGPRYVYVYIITREDDLIRFMDWQVELATDREALLYYTHGRKALIEEFVEELR